METRGIQKNKSVLNNIEITFELDKNTSLSAIDELINKELDIKAVKQGKTFARCKCLFMGTMSEDS